MLSVPPVRYRCSAALSIQLLLMRLIDREPFTKGQFATGVRLKALTNGKANMNLPFDDTQVISG